MLYEHRKRDLQYWLTKDQATWQIIANLKSEIILLESYSKHAPMRRGKGHLRVTRKRSYSWGDEDNGKEVIKHTRTNRRLFAFRNHHQWKGHHVRWRNRIIKLAHARRRLRMIQETKIPYYRERIKALGGKPIWG